MFCLVSYGLVSVVLSHILCCVSCLMIGCLIFCLVSYGLVSDVLSRILRFGVLYFVSYFMRLVSDVLYRI